MPYGSPSPQSQPQPAPPLAPPIPPPLPQKHTASSQQTGLSHWLGWPAQDGPPASTIASLQVQNSASHSRAPLAFASADSVPGRVVTNIRPPLPVHGQPTSNDHTLYKTQPPQPPQAQRASQSPLIPPIPQPAQSRPPQHSPIPPPSIPPKHGNGVVAGAIPRAPNAPPSRPAAVPGFFAMEVDELANTDYEDDDPLPLIISDLDPRFGKPLTVKSLKSPKSSAVAAAAASPSKPPGTPSSLRQPVVSVPRDYDAGPTLSYSPSHSHSNSHSLSHRPSPQSQHPTTPGKAHAATFSVSIPSFSPAFSPAFSPGGSASKSSKTLSGLPTVRPPMPQTKTKSPGGTVGRRTKSVVVHAVAGDPRPPPSTSAAVAASPGAEPQVQIKGGRPKGWKPGMSYREVALRNLGIDTTDPTLPAEFLVPLRDRRRHGKIGRPRLDGKPNAETKKRIGRPPLRKTKDARDANPPKTPQGNSGRVMYGKRIGRPPLQTVEEVQRAIFHGSTVQFVPFKCEWAGCRAELQNLETLRRHVEFVHGQGGIAAKKKKRRMTDIGAAGPLTCLWRKCATREPPVLFGSGPGSQQLKAFMDHMQYHHLEPLSWHRGDGVANNSHIGPPPAPTSISLAEKEAELHRLYRQTGQRGELEDAATEQYTSCATTAAPDMAIRVPTKYVPDYLMDSGRQVTPMLRDPVLEMSSAFWPANEWSRRIKEAYRQQNKRPERGWTG